MRSIERVKRTFRGEPIDRVGIVDYYWGLTIARWRGEGMGDAEPDYYFDHDIIYFHMDPRFGFEERFIGEDDEYRVIYTTDGETLKIPKDPQNNIARSDVRGIPVDYTISCRRDWERYKHLYRAGEWRLHSNPPLSGSWFGYTDLEYYKSRYRRAVENGKFKCLVLREPFECIREVMGTHAMLEQMALDPELVREMLRHNLDITFQMLDLLDSLGLAMDGYWVWGDIAYNKGMFFSPRMYRDLLLPVHKELLARLGDFVIYHTDGLITDCMPLLLEAGARGINPVEIKAGNNFFEVVDRYGDRIVITGGIDVRVLCTNDRIAIEKEIRQKLLHAKRKKYIYHSDHSIPYDVTLDTYRFVIDKVKEYGRYGEA
jgi:uroporphyrinogen decarboxylase